ncbi:MAG: YtfJ family protein [Halioglobus sp.]
MRRSTVRVFCGLLLIALTNLAQGASVGQPLPALNISQIGEVLLQGDSVSYKPWDSQESVSKPHILQYLPGTLSASSMYSPFTDALLAQYEPLRFHFTTIIDLEAALWGTGIFVTSEVEKSKREFPLSTMVLDKLGSGIDAWSLGKSGAGLFIIDSEGVVQFLTLGKMSAEEQQQASEIFALLMQN